MTNRSETLYSARIRESYTRIRHRSGLTVCVMPKKAAVTYAILGVNAGSNDNLFLERGAEKPFSVPDGTAHFLEHKMFADQGGEDAIARFARIGANADAYTTPDLTAYLFSSTENPYDALEILLDFVTHPYFTGENVDSERGIICEELRMYDDTPSQLGYYNLMEAMYETHPIRINVGGTEKSIRRITPEILYRFYSAFYYPENMTLVIAGNITPEAVLDVCDRCLPEQSAPFAAQRIYLPEREAVVRPFITAQAQTAIPLLYIGVKDTGLSEDPAVRMKKAAAVDILNDILFCKSSRFYGELYEKGLINGRFGVEYEHTQTYSYALISAETMHIEEVISRIRDYLAQKRRLHDITAAQFERCKRVMYASAVTAFESTEDMALDCLDAALEGGELFSSVDIMAQVTMDDLFHVLDEVYRPEQFAISVINPA